MSCARVQWSYDLFNYYSAHNTQVVHGRSFKQHSNGRKIVCLTNSASSTVKYSTVGLEVSVKLDGHV